MHAWEELRFNHVLGMNRLTWQFLRDEAKDPNSPTAQAAGIEFGFNPTIRHLVLGQQTRASAGASIPHVHKQVWGMAPRTSNLAEQLIVISDAYWRQGIDYQRQYLRALGHPTREPRSYVIWYDEHVVLYVPYGQCSRHEMQIALLRPTGHLLELEKEEVASLSKAEYIAIALYRSLGITSFNQISLSKLFNDQRAPRFRMLVIFVTREVDLAMSELSMLYVVDEHPRESANQIKRHWEGAPEGRGPFGEPLPEVAGIKQDVLKEIRKADGNGDGDEPADPWERIDAKVAQWKTGTYH